MNQRMVVSNVGRADNSYDFLQKIIEDQKTPYPFDLFKQFIESDSDQRPLLPTFKFSQEIFYANEDGSNPRNLKMGMDSYHSALEECENLAIEKVHPDIVPDIIPFMGALTKPITNFFANSSEQINSRLLACVKNISSHPESVKEQLYTLNLTEDEVTPVSFISDKGSTIDVNDMVVKLISYDYDDLNKKATIDFQGIPSLQEGEIYKVYADENHDKVFVEMFEII